MIDPNDQTLVEIAATAAFLLSPFVLAAIISALVERTRARHPRKTTRQLIEHRRAQIERNRARTTTTRKAHTK